MSQSFSYTWCIAHLQPTRLIKYNTISHIFLFHSWHYWLFSQLYSSPCVCLCILFLYVTTLNYSGRLWFQLSYGCKVYLSCALLWLKCKWFLGIGIAETMNEILCRSQNSISKLIFPFYLLIFLFFFTSPKNKKK